MNAVDNSKKITNTLHYNGLINMRYDDVKHLYSISSTRKKSKQIPVSSVTGILQVIAKPALVYWSANMAGEYIDKNLEVGKVVDEIEKAKLVKECKVAHRTKLTDAGNHGTILHKWVEDYIKGKNPPMPTNEQLLKSATQFINFVKSNKVKFLASEKKVLSIQHLFCGTFDFLAEINGKKILGDLKTSSGIYDEMWLQTAAYKGAYLEEFPDENIDHTLIVRCGKEGDIEIKELNDFEKNYEAFLSALTLKRRLDEMKRLNYIY